MQHQRSAVCSDSGTPLLMLCRLLTKLHCEVSQAAHHSSRFLNALVNGTPSPSKTSNFLLLKTHTRQIFNENSIWYTGDYLSCILSFVYLQAPTSTGVSDNLLPASAAWKKKGFKRVGEESTASKGLAIGE